MKKFGKFLATIVCLAMVAAVLFALVACDATPEENFYTITLNYDNQQGMVAVNQPLDDKGYKQNEMVTVEVLPLATFKVDAFTVSDHSDAKLDANGKYSFEVLGNTTVTVTFKSAESGGGSGTGGEGGSGGGSTGGGTMCEWQKHVNASYTLISYDDETDVIQIKVNADNIVVTHNGSSVTVTDITYYADQTDEYGDEFDCFDFAWGSYGTCSLYIYTDGYVDFGDEDGNIYYYFSEGVEPVDDWTKYANVSFTLVNEDDETDVIQIKVNADNIVVTHNGSSVTITDILYYPDLTDGEYDFDCFDFACGSYGDCGLYIYSDGYVEFYDYNNTIYYYFDGESGGGSTGGEGGTTGGGGTVELQRSDFEGLFFGEFNVSGDCVEVEVTATSIFVTFNDDEPIEAQSVVFEGYDYSDQDVSGYFYQFTFTLNDVAYTLDENVEGNVDSMVFYADDSEEDEYALLSRSVDSWDEVVGTYSLVDGYGESDTCTVTVSSTSIVVKMGGNTYTLTNFDAFRDVYYDYSDNVYSFVGFYFEIDNVQWCLTIDEDEYVQLYDENYAYYYYTDYGY